MGSNHVHKQLRVWLYNALALGNGGDLVYSSGKTPRSTSTMPWNTIAEGVSGALPVTGNAFALAGTQLDIGLPFAPPVSDAETEPFVIRTSVTAQARHNLKKGAVPPC